ncbi:AAA family ATPase [Eubacterium sp. MSJ-33]|uniref:AAA family ATPase n=1 Tax=Eubacterium sp. MSJ-33 TaxID=2841528 RepID=UPI001C7632A7|nr:AAA family ATPase [Eubacterium sp. MSJ-33]QWT52254.1 AAA family ATPase [Eubacterium sp. MSJ-33]
MWGFHTVKVKDNSRRMFDLCMRRAQSIGRADYVRTDGRMDLAHTFRTDLLHFLIYLAYSDGSINKEEVKYINLLFGTQFDERMIRDYADRWGLRTESIRDHAPRSLNSFVRSNIGAETGEISDGYYDLVQLYVTTFNYIGNDLIACNEEVAASEIQALSSYIELITQEIERVRDDMEEYKPTIAFKPGSKVKQEERPDYSYWSDTFETRRTKISTPEHPAEDTSMEREDRRTATETEETFRTQDAAEAGKSFRMRTEQPAAQTLSDQKERKKEFNTEIDIQTLLKQLNDLTGMQSVKTEINNMINLLKICKIREENGLQTPPVTNHMVFLGNPGTGKTTVARILAKIYHGLGVLSKGHLVEVDRSGLVAGYMGQTSEKVTEVIEKAKGGILFIDEAYALANGQQGDFGQEAIDILNKAMEDNREDLIVIAAGYHDEMQDFLDANPGLRSRFNRTIEFPNYDAAELVEIMSNRAKSLDYTLTDDAVQYVQDTFTRILACPPENFGNARSVRNYLDRVIHNQANRLIAENNFKEEDLTKLTLADVQSEKLE